MLKHIMDYGEFEIYVDVVKKKYVAIGLGWEGQGKNLDHIMEKCDKRLLDIKKQF